MESIDPFALILLLCGLGAVSIFILLIVRSIQQDILESKILSYDVPLDSRKEWSKFDPEVEFYRMKDEELAEISRLLFSAKAKKDRFRIRWTYTTPRGTSRYQDEVVQMADSRLDAKIQRARAMIRSGSVRVDALNSLYGEALSEGREIKDGNPRIYCYAIPESPKHRGLVKVGYASKDAHKRIAQQFQTAARLEEVKYEILFILPAITVSGEGFRDHAVHRALKNAGIRNVEGEWFACDDQVAEDAVKAVQRNAELSV